MRKAGLTYNPYQIPTADGTLGPGIAAPPAVPDPQAMFRGMGAQQAPQQQQRQQTRLLYNPESRQYLVNNTLVDDNDIEYLKRTGEYLSEPITTEVPEGSWTPVTAGDIEQHITSLADLGIPELLSSGFQTVGAGLLRGTGRLGEQLGLPDQATDLLIGAGDAVDMSDRDQARFAEYYDRNNLFQNMLSAVPQGVASIGTSVGGALAGGKAGLLVGGPAGAAAGAFIGGIATILPMMVDSAYQSAVDLRGQDWADSPEGREEVVANAMMTTFVQAVPGSIAANHILKNLSKEVARNVVRTPGRLKTAGVVGLAEAAAESSAVLIERIAFDPDTRALFDQGDLRNLMPLVAERYGEEVAISAFAGGVLGGGVGALAGGSRLVRNEEGNKLRDGESTDLTKFSDEGQVGETTGPQFQGSGRQGVLPFEEFSSRDIENLSRDVGRESVLLEPPSTPVGFDRVEPTGADDSFERQGVLPFPFPESRQLAGPADTVNDANAGDGGGGTSIPDPDIANQPRQNVIDFGVPISTSPAPEQTQSTPSPSTTPTPQTEQEQAAPIAQRESTDIGRKDKSGFNTQGAAKARKTLMGNKGKDYEVVQTNEGWFLRPTRPETMEETAEETAEGATVGPKFVATAVPPELFRGIRNRERQYPGYFFTALADRATYYGKKGGGSGQYVTTKDVPKTPLDVAALAQASKTERNNMLTRLKKYIKDNNIDVELDGDTGPYLYEVLENGETDFPYPTQLDVKFLTAEGYDSVYFAEEGGTREETYFMFNEPGDYQKKLNKALGVEPGKKTVEEHNKEIGEVDSESESESESDIDGGDNVIPTPEQIQWELLATPIPWNVLTKGQQNKWAAFMESNPELAVELPDVDTIMDNVLSESGQDIFGIIAMGESNLTQADFETLVESAFNSQLNQKNKPKEARYMARSFVKNMLAAGDNRVLNAAISFIRNSHANRKRSLDGSDPLWDSINSMDAVKSELEWLDAKNKQEGKGNTKSTGGADVDKDTAEYRLASLINRTYARSENALSRANISREMRQMDELWDEIVAQGLADTAVGVDGTPLRDYFTEDGEVKMNPKTGKMSNVAIDLETARQNADTVREDTVLAEENARNQKNFLDETQGNADDGFGSRSLPRGVIGNTEPDFGDGPLMRANGRVANPIARGKARLVVRRFVKALRNKVKVGVYTDVDDFAKRNPEAYEKAKAARPDIDTKSASGLYYGDGNVAIFTDSIRSESELRVILAHETLGHFGFRSLMPPQKLNALMESLYDRYGEVRRYVDEHIVAETGKPISDIPAAELGKLRREFTEEYMADMAAYLDTRIVARMWSAVKTFIERVTGIKFDDHMARYFINQSRKYVRNGKVDASLFNWYEMGTSMARMNYAPDDYNLGAFSRNVVDGMAVAQDAGTMKEVVGMPQSLVEAGERLRKYGVNTKAKAELIGEQLFSLRAFRFRENRGAELVFEAVTQGKETAMRIINETNDILRDALDQKVFDKFLGVIDSKQYDVANEMLYENMFYATHKFNAKSLGKTPLVQFNEETGKMVANLKEIERLRAIGELTIEDFRKGVEYEVKIPGAEEGTTETLKRKVTARPDITEKSPEWKAYVAGRRAIAHIWVEKIKADYAGLMKERDLNFRRIAERMDDEELTPQENKLLKLLSEKVERLQRTDMEVDPDTGNITYSTEATTKMNDFIENVNRTLLGIEQADRRTSDQKKAGMELRDAVELVDEAFDGEAPLGENASVGAALEAMGKRLNFGRSEDPKAERFVVQNAIKDIISHTTRVAQSERLAKQSMAQGYVPLRRRGSYQMRMVARNEKGEIVKLEDGHQNILAFRMFETPGEALEITKRVNEQLLTENGKPVVFDGIRAYAKGDDAEGFRPMKVTLEAVAEKAMTAQSGPMHLNLNEFMVGLSRFNIVLHPKKMNEVVVALTAQNNAARRRLLKEGRQGYDPNATRAITEFAESMGSNIAKSLMRPQVSEYMDLKLKSSQKLWNGDEGYLRELKSNWDVLVERGADEKAIVAAKRKYFKYAFQMRNTKPKNGINRANMYRNEASSLLSFLDGNASLEQSDFEEGKVISQLRAYTSIFQLGGSMATGALNYIGVWMNGLPFLMSYNENRAFGGGFGNKTIGAFVDAMNQVGLRAATLESGLNSGDFYDKLIDISSDRPNAAAHNKEAARLRTKYKLTEDEARFIRDETNEGVMKPAQSNALLGTARGRTEKAVVRKGIDGWMWIFNQTEQASRRSLGLTAYRLELDRQMAALPKEVTHQDILDARDAARKFAVEAIELTVGRYDVMNRPPVWRGGVASLFYMYKVFPTTTIQMLRNLSRPAQMGFLLGMFFLSGISGLPFAEDLEDIIDTIGQTLHADWRGTRIELGATVDKVLPGFSPIFIRGVVNQLGGPDVGIRTSLGDFIPGTGIMLAGANVSQEAGQLLGPMFGMLESLATTLPDFIRASVGTVTGNQRVTFLDVARNSPITIMRAFGDAFAYNSSGAIVDRRGYIVSENYTVMDSILRMTGWYPVAASQNYDVVASAMRMSNYQKDIAASYRIAWIKAKVQGDEARARAIVESVREWNNSVDPSLQINNFLRGANRGLREANMNAVERVRRSMPVSARDDYDLTANILGYND